VYPIRPRRRHSARFAKGAGDQPLALVREEVDVMDASGGGD